MEAVTGRGGIRLDGRLLLRRRLSFEDVFRLYCAGAGDEGNVEIDIFCDVMER